MANYFIVERFNGSTTRTLAISTTKREAIEWVRANDEKHRRPRHTWAILNERGIEQPFSMDAGCIVPMGWGYRSNKLGAGREARDTSTYVPAPEYRRI